MSTLWQNLQYKMLRSGNKLNLLIGINVIVYLLVNITSVLETLLFRSHIIDNFSNEYLLLTANLHLLPVRFWTPVTYMFMHAGVLHILFNMLMLYWFGQIFEEYLSNKRTIGLYFMGGLAGALLYILCYNTLPFFTQDNAAATSTLVGASASVMAIIVATATLLPNYEISIILIGPVKLKWLVTFFLVLDFLGTIGPNAGGEIAHLGGALMGFVYIKQLQKGHDWIAGIANIFKSKSKLKVVSKNSFGKSDGKPRQEEIDLILDKISQSGYDSLNKQEKEILFRASSNEG
ncbi:rhomboid family intramembrane serine protease [Mucilaginibacter sp. BJC16-A38]|uniref:rhomboid family protein n=1 Tax=Mucilaginibacter phenanthrenivorans TaxID=1234842 RepID=UPI002156F9E9|nr:rhomboid family intramembrane serine protease [Mucilaginibacter phenanthrenivorans]MCR8559131.1 rhomboid family intramembrane serine protease [Mucilaginibacter phenanthrenivorans]